MNTNKEHDAEEGGDQCCICLDALPHSAENYVRYTCCGNGIHFHCHADLKSTKMGANCPLCRAKSPTSHEESVNQIIPWVEKKKAWAQNLLGQRYFNGNGVKQSYEIAKELYEQATEQLDLGAMYNLGCMYQNGYGVAQSYEKAKELFEHAGHLGNVNAQFNLGALYVNGIRYGFEKDLTKARKWFTKADAQGDKNATNALEQLDNEERRLAGRDPDAIVCDTCGLPRTTLRKLVNCPCRSARYCNKKCQKKHRKEHKKECKRLIAEMKQEKMKQATTTTTTTTTTKAPATQEDSATSRR